MVLYGLDCSNMRWLSDIIAASFMGIVFQNLFFFFPSQKNLLYTDLLHGLTYCCLPSGVGCKLDLLFSVSQ